MNDKKKSNIQHRMKYCSVHTCKNYYGTLDDIRMFRFPKNREVSKKWNISIGIDPDKILNGHICSKHFDPSCFKYANKFQLLADAVPTIFEIFQHQESENIISDIATEFNTLNSLIMEQQASSTVSIDDVDVSEIDLLATTDEAVATTYDPKCSQAQCNECQLKDEIIEEKEEQIRNLKASLKRAQKKVWYLETVRVKLDAALKSLKEQTLVNQEQCRTLEVYMNLQYEYHDFV